MSGAVSSVSTFGEPDVWANGTSRKVASTEFSRRSVLHGNLARFLDTTTPNVLAQNNSKLMRNWSTHDKDCGAYFKLGDLWKSYKEWSAYGAGVPLVLNGRDSVVQYYVPYLSGIQLYADSNSQLLDSSDIYSFRDTSSDGSSDLEIDGECKCSGNWHKNCITSYHMSGIGKLTMNESPASLRNEFSIDDSDCGDSHCSLIFEYLEYDRPYCREPLADKIAYLAKQFPVLKTIKSCDLLPTSWFSVAWYPIYRIPIGPTLRDLDACFLTFHFLSTSIKGSAFGPTVTNFCGVDGAPKISLPVFGLASYKLRSSIWTYNMCGEGNLAKTLHQAADKWLQLVKTNLPDYCFFASQNTYLR